MSEELVYNRLLTYLRHLEIDLLPWRKSGLSLHLEADKQEHREDRPKIILFTGRLEGLFFILNRSRKFPCKYPAIEWASVTQLLKYLLRSITVCTWMRASILKILPKHFVPLYIIAGKQRISKSLRFTTTDKNQAIEAISGDLLNGRMVIISNRCIKKVYYGTARQRVISICDIHKAFDGYKLRTGSRTIATPRIVQIRSDKNEFFEISMEKIHGEPLDPRIVRNLEIGLEISPLIRTTLDDIARQDNRHRLKEILSLENHIKALFDDTLAEKTVTRLINRRLLKPMLTLEQTGSRLSHGDLWLGNLILYKDTVYVLDFDKAAFLPDWYDTFYMVFNAILQFSNTKFYRWYRPVNSFREAHALLNGEYKIKIRSILIIFHRFIRKHSIPISQINLLESCYFRLQALSWANDPAWHPEPEIAINIISDYADALEAEKISGILVELLNKVEY